MAGEDFLPPVVASLSISIDQFIDGLNRAKAELAAFVAEAKSAGDIQLKVEAATDGLKESVTRAVEEAKAGEDITIPAKVEAVDLDEFQRTGQVITVPVEPDAATLPEKVRADVDEAKAAAGKIEIPVDIDSNSILDATGRLRDSFGRYVVEPLKIPVDIDEQALDRATKAWAQGTAPVKIPAYLDNEKLLSDIQAAWSRAGAAGKITIPADIDTSSVLADARGLQSAMRDVDTVLKADSASTAQAMSDSWSTQFEQMKAKTQQVADDMASRSRLVDAAWRDVAEAEAAEASKAGDDAGRNFIGRYVDAVRSGSLKLGQIDLNPGAGRFMVPFDIIGPGLADLGQLTGILGLIPAGFTAAATAAATFKVGMVDVSAAVKAYQDIEKQQDAQSAKTVAQQAQELSSANAVDSAYKAQADANRSLADAKRTASDTMIKANQDVANAQQKLDDANRTTTNDIINATQAVARAKQDETRAEQTAAQNNEQALQAEQKAEQDLASAQMAATRAQTALTDARTAASRSIEDLQHRVADDALSVQAATLNIQQAQVDLNNTLADPKATQLQREQAQLNYQQQVQQLSDIQLQYQRAQDDSAKAASLGVDGAKQVVDAQDSLTQAQTRVSDAVQAVGEAQEKVTQTAIDGAQSVIDAQQKVADSQRALTNAQIDGAERIKTAQRDLATAQRTLAADQITTAESVQKAQEGVDSAGRQLNLALLQQRASVEALNAPFASYQVALDKLAPSAREAVVAFNALTGPDHSPFENLHLDVQQRLFAGLSDEIKNIGNVDLPVLRTGMDGMADAINTAAHNIGDFLTAPASVSDWQEIFTNIDTAAQDLAPSVSSILQIFTDLVTVGSEFLPQLATDFTKGAQSVADFVHNARETGQLHQWIQDGIDTFSKLWGIVKDLASLIKDIFIMPGGDFGLLTIAKGLLDIFTAIVNYAPWLLSLVEGFFLVTRVVSFTDKIIAVYNTFTKIYDMLGNLIVKAIEWASGMKLDDIVNGLSGVRTAEEETATTAEQAARDQQTAYAELTTAARETATAMTEAAAQMRQAWTDTALGAEAAKVRIKTADEEAQSAIQAEATATEEAAARIKTAYAETATAAETAATSIRTADAEAGAAAEGEAAAGGAAGLAGKGALAGLAGAGGLALLGTSLTGPVISSLTPDFANAPTQQLSLGQMLGLAGNTVGKAFSLDFSGVIDNVKRAWNDETSAQDGATSALQGYVDKQKTLEDEQRRINDALHAGDAALDTRRGFMLSSIDDTIRFNDELASAQQSIAQHGRTLDLNTDAGRRNMQQLQQLSDTVMQNLSDMQKNGATQDQVTQKTQYYHDKLETVAQQLGMTKKDADNYVGALNLIPSDKTTTTHSNVTPMTDLTNQYVNAIKGVPNDWNTNFTSNLGVQMAALQDYINHIGYLKNLTPIQTTIDIAQSIPHALGGIDIVGMAEGGLRTMTAGVANIVGPNTPTLIGDNKSVNESYIPWIANSRTDEILDETAQALGRTILPRGFDLGGAAGLASSDVLTLPGQSGIDLSTSVAPTQQVINYNITVPIQGSVVSERELMDVIRTNVQQYGSRNSGSGFSYGTFSGR